MEPYLFLQDFLPDAGTFDVIPFGNGLIHKTYLVQRGAEPIYVLQEVNTAVFTDPLAISMNLHHLNDFLVQRDTTNFFPMPIPTISGMDYAEHSGTYFRLTPFVKGTHALDSCLTPEQAFEASRQFGKFTAAFKGFDTNLLKPTIPGFHDLGFRWTQFTTALIKGNPSRISLAHKQIQEINAYHALVERYNTIQQSASFLKRVTHHDTKISNVLFDQADRGACVIDLDTVMPGFFISDVGDMCRTYLSPGNEEDKDLSRVFVRKEFYDAIMEGYLEYMHDQMTQDELKTMNYAGEFMIYMQALRFLTDFLNDDVYYGSRYPMHNLDRTINQLHLLNDFIRVTR
jgi:Ser/Thr protein kinase RdoA (MazF antagonist)